MCKSGVALTNTVIFSNRTFSYASNFVKVIVGTLSLNYEFSDEIIDGYGPGVWRNMGDITLDPNHICSTIALCDDLYYERSYATDFEMSMAARTPPVN